MGGYKINKCDCCGIRERTFHYDKESATNLPVGWCYITMRASGVHDSDSVEFTYHYTLCDRCRSKFLGMMKEGE